MAFVPSLFVPHLSFIWCLGRTVLRDCGIDWVSFHTVEPQWLEHLWDHRKLFETWVGRVTES